MTEAAIQALAKKFREKRNTKCREREFPCDVCAIPKFDGCLWLARIALTEETAPLPGGLERALA